MDGDASNSSSAFDSRRHRISGKLNELLAQSNQFGHESSVASMTTRTLHESGDRTSGSTSRSARGESSSRRSTPSMAKRTGVAKSKRAPRSPQHLPKLGNQQLLPHHQQQQQSAVMSNNDNSRALSRQQTHRSAPSSRREDDHHRPATRRGEKLIQTNHGFARDDGNGGGSGAGVRGDDALSHHPHIAQVLQQMASGAPTLASSTSSRSSASAGAHGGNSLTDTDETRPSSALEKWTERSNAYKTIALRTTEALQSRSERLRWDSLHHFTHAGAAAPASSISESLLQRLSASRSRVSGQGDSSSSIGGNKSQPQSAREDAAEKRKRTNHEYAVVQEQIGSRLQRERKKVLVASAKNTRTKAPGGAQTGAIGAEGRSRALLLPSTPVTGSNNIVEQAAPEASISPASKKTLVLGASSSVPTLGTPPAMSLTNAASLIPAATASNPHSMLAHSLSASHLLNDTSNARSGSLVRGMRDVSRNSLVERKLRSSQSHARRKESLIGAPVLTDFSTIGHHSNARMEERRYSAQTWAWHHPTAHSSSNGGALRRNANGRLDERDEDDDDDEDGDDTFGYSNDRDDDDNDGGDGNNDDDALDGDRDDDTDADDASSVAHSSYDLETARSSRSGASMLLQSAARKRRQLKKRYGKLRHQSSNSSLYHHHASGHSSGSLALQSRLEEIWKALEFPFSRKLLMLEKYAELQDAETFESALASWERVGEVVLVRERMKAALAEFAEHDEVKAPSRLTGSEWMFLRSLQLDTPGEGIYLTMSSHDLVTWVSSSGD